MKKLNLGCGENIKEGYINSDCMDFEGIDLICDLNKFPYPIRENEFDEVLLLSVYEHLENPLEVLKELYRITKNKGKIIIEVPHFSSMWAWSDITHKRPYSFYSFQNYDIENLNKERFNSLEKNRVMKFKINKKINVSIIFRIFGFGIIANKFPYIYERFLANIIPAGNIKFELEPINMDTEEQE